MQGALEHAELDVPESAAIYDPDCAKIGRRSGRLSELVVSKRRSNVKTVQGGSRSIPFSRRQSAVKKTSSGIFLRAALGGGNCSGWLLQLVVLLLSFPLRVSPTRNVRTLPHVQGGSRS